jgi:hypothetical protein
LNDLGQKRAAFCGKPTWSCFGRSDQAWKIWVGETADGDAEEAGIEFHKPVNGSAEMGTVVGGEHALA